VHFVDHDEEQSDTEAHSLTLNACAVLTLAAVLHELLVAAGRSASLTKLNQH
jgi:hypothetical protein